jgi:outer membrane protein TolC
MARLKNITGIKETPDLTEIDFSGYEDFIQYCAGLDINDIDAIYVPLWDAVRKNNTTLAKAELANQRAEKNIDLAKKDYLPSLSASLSTGLGTSYQYGSKTNGLDPFSGTLSIKVSVPLDFWVTSNKVEKQKNAQAQTILSYQDTVFSVEIETQTAFLDLITQAGSVVSLREAYEYAQEHFEYVQELYRLSQKSIQEFSDAANLQARSRNQLTAAHYGFLQALSKIRGLGAFDDDAALIAFLNGARHP